MLSIPACLPQPSFGEVCEIFEVFYPVSIHIKVVAVYASLVDNIAIFTIASALENNRTSYQVDSTITNGMTSYQSLTITNFQCGILRDIYIADNIGRTGKFYLCTGLNEYISGN